MSEFATVRVTQGSLRGRCVATKNSNKYFSFQGVPYARPPVGLLRFKVAQPAESWEGTRDALKEGPSCPQIEWYIGQPYRGDEDCLYLNVYSPNLPSTNRALKYPVMVWIHGGGFVVGSGDTDMYGPEHFMDANVVIVTFNYRLGIFGFLSVDDESQPDNVGLKDQVAALRWVKENIAAFGGDPDNITIFGESAGAASVHYHLLSPMSKGLFHKAILQSGSAVSSWATADKPQEFAFRVAKQLGSNASSIQELLIFLNTVPTRALVEALHVLYDEKLRGGPQLNFGPVPETRVKPEEEVFLPADPREMMEKRHFQSVPCIIGMNSQEGIFILDLVGLIKNTKNLSAIGENLESQIPSDVLSNSSSKTIAQKIKKFYFGNEAPTEKSINEFVDLQSDIMFTRGIDKTVKILSESTSPVFYYHFDFSGKLNIFKNFVQANYLTGASHLDELGYLFESPVLKTPVVETGSRDDVTRRRMLKLWTNFAKTGNPTPDFDPVIGIQWPPYTQDNSQYLNINDSLSLGRDLYSQRIAFWDTL